MSKEETIDKLLQSVQYYDQNETDQFGPDDASWNYQHGVLLSINEAKSLIDSDLQTAAR